MGRRLLWELGSTDNMAGASMCMAPTEMGPMHAWMNLGFGPFKFLAFFEASNPFEEMDEERWQPEA